MLTTDWIIYKPITAVAVDGVPGIVREVRYAVRALNGEEVVRTHQGVARLDLPPINEEGAFVMTPFEALTDAQILDWIWGYTDRAAAEELVINVATHGNPGSNHIVNPPDQEPGE